jgi:hypothetical protein
MKIVSKKWKTTRLSISQGEGVSSMVVDMQETLHNCLKRTIAPIKPMVDSMRF